MARTGLAVTGSFFRTWKSYTIAYWSGHRKTELDLLLLFRNNINVESRTVEQSLETISQQYKSALGNIGRRETREL